MRIAIGSDHGGFKLKQEIFNYLKNRDDVQINDFGTYSTDSVDYPDIAFMVSLEVARGNYDFGILIDGIGIGSAMAANKVKGILAATCNDPVTAEAAREHDKANVLVMGSGIVGKLLAFKITDIFLATPFGGGRHERRINKILKYEESSGTREELISYSQPPKSILTRDDLILLMKEGRAVVYVENNAIITPLAREFADEKKIRIITR